MKDLDFFGLDRPPEERRNITKSQDFKTFAEGLSERYYDASREDWKSVPMHEWAARNAKAGSRWEREYPGQVCEPPSSFCPSPAQQDELRRVISAIPSVVFARCPLDSLQSFRDSLLHLVCFHRGPYSDPAYVESLRSLVTNFCSTAT